MKSYKVIEIPIYIFFIILAVLLYRSTASFPESSQTTTAIYVKILSISLGILGFVQLILTFFHVNLSLNNLIKSPKKFLILVILLVIYVWIINVLGFNVSSVLYMVITMYAMGYRKHIKAILISILTTFSVYFLFYKIFEIPLPKGMLF